MKYFGLFIPVILVMGVVAYFCMPAKKVATEDTPMSKYEIALDKCDMAYAECSRSDNSLIDCLDTQMDCYLSIIYEIYDKYHTSVAQERRKDLNAFIEAAQNMHYDAYQPDFCRPSCGTIASTGSRIDVLYDLQGYIHSLVSSLPWGDDTEPITADM